MDDLPINITDIALIALLLLSGLLAFSRGFVKEVLSIARWIGAAVAALEFYPLLTPHIRPYVQNEQLTDIAAAAAVFLGTLIVLWVVTEAISRRIQNSDIGALDRSLGFLFGLARGAVLVALCYLILVQVVKPREQWPWLQEARSLPAIQYGANLLYDLTPEHIRSGLNAVAEQSRPFTEQVDVLRGALTGDGQQGAAVQQAMELWRGLSAVEQQRLLQSLEPAAQGRLRELLRQYESGADSGGDTGYKSSERQELKRLFPSSSAE